MYHTQEFTVAWVAIAKLWQNKAGNFRLKTIISIMVHKGRSDGG
jgi:hypothetical protein